MAKCQSSLICGREAEPGKKYCRQCAEYLAHRRKWEREERQAERRSVAAAEDRVARRLNY